MDNAQFSLRIGHADLIGKRIQAGIGVLRFSTLLLLWLIATGCCAVVALSGDAKILKCHQLIHSRDSKLFRMVLPTVSLAHNGANVIKVRNLPAYLKGSFKYDLSMDVATEEIYPNANAPWHDAKISISFRKLDGTEMFKQSLLLGQSSHGFEQGHNGWKAGWNLGAGSYSMDPVPVNDDSFDIIVTVEQPSLRPTDKIALAAFAIYVQKPSS